MNKEEDLPGDPSPGSVREEDGAMGYHTVMPGDTLQGICLLHGVSALDVRRLNNCTNANIVALKVVKLPSATREEHPDITASKKRASLLQEFREESGEGAIEAQYYLEDHHWRVDLALAAWKNDDEFAEKASAGNKK